MLPEELARVKIDKQLSDAGWDIVSRFEYLPNSTSAIKEALMIGGKESDYLLFIDGKAIAVVEAKKEENNLGKDVADQAEDYSVNPQDWYGLWFPNQIPLVYLANGKKIYFKNMLLSDSEYVELTTMHTPKQMLKIIGKESKYGALPKLKKNGLRDCQYEAEIALEASLKAGERKALAVLATGAGKTYFACLAAYRLMNYTSEIKRILFLVDRNNLARQTESEFKKFDRTESGQKLGSLYEINRLKKSEDIAGDVVISTIQKLFSVLTGQSIEEDDEDKEDELLIFKDNEKDTKPIELGDDLKLPPDYFQFIIVDECHRSIYGKWKKVLDYFKDAKILGLTATPTPEAYAYFNIGPNANKPIKNYTYDDSIVDGVNVPSRLYSIKTAATIHGGTIDKGETVKEQTRINGDEKEFETKERLDYSPNQLDRSVVNPNQIKSVLETYRDIIYTELYPNREPKWEYIPKTLIFAKDDHHATVIVDMLEEVFKEKFNGEVPEHFARKITYKEGDSNALIRDLRTEKDFRIAVTVTLVATGTDVKPLEIVLFMSDVKSEVLYTQMKGRGCRVIKDDKLKEVTPNADTKDCFYIVDAVGVAESDKTMPKPSDDNGKIRIPSLEQIIEHLSHGELSDDNLKILCHYCSTIQRRYENNVLFRRHLDRFITTFNFAPRTLANTLNEALAQGKLPPYYSPSDDNSIRFSMVSILIGNLEARKQLLELQKGYYLYTPDEPDEVIYKGFSKESAREFITVFEKYLNDNKDSIEALRILYNSEKVAITHSMLCELNDKLMAANRLFTPYHIWNNYKMLDSDGVVDELNKKQNVNALTNLIQLVRFAFKKNLVLTSLFGGYMQRFNLYCGQAQRELTEEQKEVMKQIAEYILSDGAFDLSQLNQFDADLWRKAILRFNSQADILAGEMNTLSKFILKVA